MTFLQPWWFLLLALAAVIIALHVRRRRQVPVASLMIWQHVQPEEARRPVRGMPPITLPLVLQLLALLLITLALVRPQFGGNEGPGHWLVLIDTSAPVREHGMPVSVGDLLERHPDARLTLVEVNAQPLVRATRVEQRHAISTAEPVLTDGDSDWLAALRLVSGLVLDTENTLVTVVAPPATVREASLIIPAMLPGATAEYITSGPDGPNNRFLHVELNTAGTGWQLAGTVANDSEVRVFFRPEGAESALQWAAFETVHGAFSGQLEFPGSGRLELRLPADSLSADNTYRLEVQPEPAALTARLDGFEDRALERALIAAGTVTDSDAPDLLVRNETAAADPGTASLTFLPGDGTASGSVTAAGTPLATGVDFRGLELASGRVLEPGVDESVVLQTAQGPVALLRHTGSGPQVTVGFSLADSNWPALTSFPAFIANLVDLLRPATACLVGQPCRTGAEVTVTDPEGTPLVPDAAGYVTPLIAGIHEAGGRPLPVNLAGPVRRLAGTGATPAEPEHAGNAPEPWRVLVMLAALVLLAEAALALRDSRRRPLGLVLQAAATAVVLVALAGIQLRTPVTVDTRALLSEHGTDASMPRLEIGGEPGVAAGGLADGLQLARGLLPAGGELVVAGSGSLLRGEMDPAVRQLQADGIIVHALHTTDMPGDEVVLAGLDIPPAPYDGESWTATARVYSASPAQATVSLNRSGTELASRNVALETGMNAVDFTVDDEAGTWLYEATVTADIDSEPENNRFGSFVTVLERPRVAVVTRQTDLGDLFAHALNVQGMAARLLSPVSLPWNEEGFRAYDSIVLLDLPALELHSTQQHALEEWVSQHGGGLLILGGANTYGPGGYYQTPLEDVSPLSSLVDRESPEVALLFVLDRSGSMQQEVGETNRLEIAKEATLGAIRVLGAESQAGIIMFDTTAEVLVPIMSTADLAPFEAALAPLAPSGGTAIHPALVHALEQMRDVEATAKHIIVMTDGLSQPADFAPVLRDLRELNVTISTVAIGQGADVTGLANIARLGAGATHATTDFRALPSILGQEAMLLAGNSVEEQTVTPEWLENRSGADFSLLAGLPDLNGFTRTSLKDDAVLHLQTVDSDGEQVPLLATWKYGLGNVASFASQGAGPWVIDWMELEEFPALWAELVRWTLPAVARPGMTVDAELRGDELLVSLTAVTADGRPRSGLDLEAVLLDPDGGTADVKLLRALSDGVYEARLLLGGAGVNWLGISPRSGSPEVLEEQLELPVLVPYAASLDHSAANPQRLEALAAATGGSVITERDLSPQREVRWVTAPDPVPWLLAGLAAFLAALFLRYGSRRRPRTA